MRLLRRRAAGLRIKLFIAHVLVILVGVGTLFVAASIATPRLFESHMVARGIRGPGRSIRPAPMTGMMAQMDELIADAFREAVTQALAVAGVAALATAAVVSLFVSGWVAGTVRRLAAASRRIAAGHYTERVPEDSEDELGQLAVSFNAMAAALEATERRRLELIGDVTHELRTPIATLEGYLEGLLDGVVPPSDQTWAKLHAEAGRLRRLVEDLQNLSRAEAHQLALVLRPVEPERIVRTVVDRLGADFAAKGLGLEVQVAPALPAVQADPDRTVQVLTNLLTNALRYTPAPGRVHVMVSRVGDTVQFRVGDTGIGIAPEHLPHLFDRFYRVDKSRSRALGGTGVGLTIARALVEAMGGRIWAESAGLGRGATFSFDLPLAR